MKHVISIVSLGLVLHGAAVASLPPQVVTVRDLVNRLEIDIQVGSWASFRKIDKRNEPGSTLYRFEVERWRFTTTATGGVVSGYELSLGGARPSRPIKNRPAGLSRQDAEDLVRRILSRIGWEEGRDFVISNSIDAEHPEFGKMAEAQGGLHVIELGAPTLNGFTDSSGRGNFSLNVATGKVVQFLLVTKKPDLQFEAVNALIPVKDAARKARLAAVAAMKQLGVAVPENLPSDDLLAEQVSKHWGLPGNIPSDEGIVVEGLPSALLNAKIRPALYSFNVAGWIVRMHATTGCVVGINRSNIAGASALSPAQAHQESSSVASPFKNPFEPQTPTQSPPPVALWMGMGLAGFVLGAAFVLTRKRS
jgi:hypothetical protein